MNFFYKTSSYITIPFFIFLIFFTFYFFLEENLFFIKTPIFLSIFLICIIFLFIIEIINKIIFYQKKKIKKKIKKIKKIDHGFDGILELDNPLPNWWVKLFYITIFFSIIYFFSFIFTDFFNSEKEYKISLKKHVKKITFFESKIPQITIKNASFKKEFFEEGKILFKENCATCHNLDGSGNIGPNLTDDYWINTPEKDLFKNIFYIIWNGSKNNSTMRAFGRLGEIKGNDIEKIASYVYLINKNYKKPLHGKFPQGKKIIWK